ncbi:MAG: tRNA adenosine(34) deaminase TadA [Nitrospiraceae bacterium]|nr:tRNA adenosine(34) deaminase TadA [Nitrospiraceae bacterium]
MDQTDKNIRFMKAAIDEAAKAVPEGDVPVGAVLVVDGEILAAAHNRKESSNDPTAHAEVLALREGAMKLGRWRLSDAILYVTKEPCPMCAGAMVNARLGALVYGCADKKGGAAGSLFDIPSDGRLNHQVHIESGVLEDECRGLLKGFFFARRMAV